MSRRTSERATAGLGPYRRQRVTLRLASYLAVSGWVERVTGGDDAER